MNTVKIVTAEDGKKARLYIDGKEMTDVLSFSIVGEEKGNPTIKIEAVVKGSISVFQV